MKGKAEGASVPALTPSYKSPIFNQQTFGINNYKSELVSETRRNGKVIRLFRCFGCDRCFSAKLMNGFLIFCKDCLNAEQLENERSRQRFVEKTLTKIGAFLRRRV